MTARYRRNDQIIDRVEPDGEYFLFNPITAKFNKLNRIAGLVWEVLGETHELDGLTDAVFKRVKGVDRSTLEADLRRLLDDMESRDLVVVDA
ncbi:hypothetical protein AQI88_08330 [Streptomyces cellostaticus]|uniref:PqqD family protein n=1 Tax=Streptomyces cellostaticus TaxID=67285 RepID=A0A101NQE7_9ACTN|nr:PqqD family protein [Streptomyces cellostaticus]KUM97272.1 hypothetical protein AQI88_08330 [Streptomyces cellostaticus]GHI03934.1 hypothetical protein Scel_22550 [Streptomyces cellostaticus]